MILLWTSLPFFSQTLLDTRSLHFCNLSTVDCDKSPRHHHQHHFYWNISDHWNVSDVILLQHQYYNIRWNIQGYSNQSRYRWLFFGHLAQTTHSDTEYVWMVHLREFHRNSFVWTNGTCWCVCVHSGVRVEYFTRCFAFENVVLENVALNLGII